MTFAMDHSTGVIVTPKKKKRTHASALPVLLALTCYQWILCFVNTNIANVSNPVVAGTEIVLLAWVALRVVPKVPLKETVLVLLILCYFVALWAFRGVIDTAGPRNIIVIFLAFALGRLETDRREVNKIVWIVSGIVLVAGLAEYFATSTYYHYFNVLHYYIARGEVSEVVPVWVKQDSFVSGLRTGGRNLLPFLGELRVSSIFLEPVSMGNYAIVLCAWALSFDGNERRQAIAHFFFALLFIVLSDSRFASLLVLFLLVLRFIPGVQSRGFVFSLVFISMAALIGFTLAGVADPFQDNLPGRLMRSGVAVLNMDLAQLVGFGIPDPLPDMGLAYSLEHFGLFLCIALWVVFAAPRLQIERASRYRLMMALYCISILAISGTSFYSTKTGVLAWFLYGALCSGFMARAKEVPSQKISLVQGLT